MIIYFLESNKIYTFKLPLEISGNYILSDYDVNGNKRSLVSVEASNGNWVIKDNDEVKIYYDSMYKTEATLQLYHFYQLVVYGTDTVLMYVAPAYDNSFVCTRISTNATITCGNSGCDINFPSLGEKQLELNYINGDFSFKNLNPNIPIYVNNARKESGTLANFDMIFIMGLRILILGGNIYVNNPNSLVTFLSSKFSQPQLNLVYQDYKANSDFYKDFYDEKDYFYKTPVFQNALEEFKTTVASPPQKNTSKPMPVFMQVIPSALMSVSSMYMGYKAFSNIATKQGSMEENMLSIVTCVTMLIGSILWPFVESFYEKITNFAAEKKRVSRYSKYLRKKEDVFADAVQKQKAVLIERYLSLPECKEAIYNKNPNLFSRNYDSDYFLSVRLGVGDVLLYSDVSFGKEEYTEVDDKLVDKAADLVNRYKYLKDSPYSISLYEKNILAFIGPDELKNNYLNAILLQLATYHVFTELKLVILTDNAAPTVFSYLKESNYCFSDDKSFRFYANNFDDGQILSEYLEKVFASRNKEESNNNSSVKDKSNFPYYLIVSDNISMYKNLKIIKDVLEQKSNKGFGIIMFDSRVNNIPDGCENFINYTEKEGYYFTAEMNVDSIRKFKPEFIGTNYIDIDVDDCISRISNIPLKVEISDSGQLPDSLGFLEMYGVGRVEQLNILKRWETSNIVNSLATPIGVDANGNLLNLDLHEKKHGPHGLIAGMTGSGKSECIITYILSLAVNYSPNEVQFVLIDYKGGGLAGAFENRKTGIKLPHLVGTITNLDQAEMKRTLVSIKSELQRRQRIFNEAKEKLNTGTIDIYKYQRLVRDGKLDEHLAHLFIICDEFAELKAQQPDFMDELVSAARIGRSLGVHLILATQKPSGVVDDQIWSNSKFKICCKVQTAEDSNEMIRKPDAAFIKEAGRFYLQVGYDEYFVKGQSAYTGTSYIPSDKIRSKYSTAVEFINNLGDIIKTVSEDDKADSPKVNLGEELTNILNYIIKVANESGFKYQQLWLDNVPKILYLDDVRKKYPLEIKPFDINPLIGEYDDPKNQKQGPVRVDLTTGGNTFITGVTGSGKTTFLSTMIYSIITTHTVDEVNIYIVDLGAETLRKFSLAPQVGDVLTINEKSRVEKMFYFLQRQMEKRKKYYSVNGGSFENDLRNGKSIFPNIIIIINLFDIFKEQFEDIYENIFSSFTRECNRYGITFCITGADINALGYIISNNFSQTIALKLSDSSDYIELFSNSNVIPSSNSGRGLIKNEQVYEFQTALIDDYDNIEKMINYVIEKLNKVMNNKAMKVPEIPSYVTISSFRNESISLSSVPIGIELKSACSYFYDFNKLVNIITFGKEAGVKSFIPALVDILSYLTNVKTLVFSAYDYLTIENEKIKYYDSNFKGAFKTLKNNLLIKNNDINNKNQYIVLIFGYTKLNNHLTKLKETDNGVVNVDDVIVMFKETKLVRFILVDSINLLKSIDNVSWYNLVNLSNGILLSSDFDNQDLFNAKYQYNENGNIGPNDAIAINNGDKSYIRFVNHN